MATLQDSIRAPKRLVVLRTGDAAAPVAARRGEFFSWIRREVGDAWDGEWHEHDVRTESPLPAAGSADGFIITGSSSSVTERAPWMLRAEGLVRAIVAAETPLFGICFGHQMVAQALGGEVTKNPRGREIGTIRVRVRDGAGVDPILDGVGSPFLANATHVDSVAKLPRDATVLAETDLDPCAAFVIGARVKCVQFHPEFDEDSMRGYVEARSHLIAAEGGDAAGILSRVSAAPGGAATLKNFVARVVRGR